MFLQSCHVVCLVLFSEIRQAGKGSCRQCVCLKRGNLRVTECDLWCCAWVYALYFYPSFSLESWLNCVGVKLPNSNPFLIISHFVTYSLPWHHYWKIYILIICLFICIDGPIVDFDLFTSTLACTEESRASWEAQSWITHDCKSSVD